MKLKHTIDAHARRTTSGGGQRASLSLLILAVSLYLAGGNVPLVGIEDARAETYLNCATTEPGVNSDPNTLMCDDFEDGSWYRYECRSKGTPIGQPVGPANPANDGWCGNTFNGHVPSCDNGPYPEGEVPCVDQGNGGGGGTDWARCSPTITTVNNRAFALSDCAAFSGVKDPSGGGHAMADHSFIGQTEYDEIYFRYYIYTVAGGIWGHEKMVSFNPCCAGIGGIKFVNLISSSGVNEPAQPVIKLQHEGGIPLDQNVSFVSLAHDRWYYIEVHIKLNKPAGASNGTVEFWIDDCGPDGLSCPTVQNTTLIGRRTDVIVDNDGSRLGSVWIENWSNQCPCGPAEHFYDNVVLSTQRIGPAVTGGGGDTTPPGAPTNLRISKADAAARLVSAH